MYSFIKAEIKHLQRSSLSIRIIVK